MAEASRAEWEFLKDNRLLNIVLDDMERSNFDVAAASHPKAPERVSEALAMVNAIRLLRAELRRRASTTQAAKRPIA